QQAQILGAGRALTGVRIPVLDRQVLARGAAVAVFVDGRAASTVALGDLAHEVDRHVSRVGLRRSALARFAGAETALLLLREQRVERAIEQRREIAARQRVAEQPLGLVDLRFQLGTDAELNRPARLRKWLYFRGFG